MKQVFRSINNNLLGCIEGKVNMLEDFSKITSPVELKNIHIKMTISLFVSQVNKKDTDTLAHIKSKCAYP